MENAGPTPFDASKNVDSRSLIERLVAGAWASAMVGGSAAVAYFDPATAGFFPVCPLFALTGFACPGCGLTRGFHALFHGDLVSAIDFNLMTPVWAIVFGWVLISLILFVVRGRGLPMWPTYPKVLWVFLVVLVVFGIARNIPIWPLTFLFP
jgi:hypothetical protein